MPIQAQLLSLGSLENIVIFDLAPKELSCYHPILTNHTRYYNQINGTQNVHSKVLLVRRTLLKNNS